MLIQESSELTKARGFSLVEVLVSIAIIALILLPLAYGLNLTLKANKSYQEKADKLGKLTSLVNYLSTLNFDDSCLEIGNYTCVNNPCCNGLNQTNITYSVSEKDENLKLIKVEWKDEKGSFKLFRLKGDWQEEH